MWPIFPEVTYLVEILSSGVWICLENNRLSLESYPKAIAWEKRIKVLMTEADIAQAMKEILGARVVYVFACLHLARWISVRNNSEIKGKKSIFDRLDPCASCLLEFTLQKIQLCVKSLGAEISSVTFPEFSYLSKTKPEMNLAREIFVEFALGKSPQCNHSYYHYPYHYHYD